MTNTGFNFSPNYLIYVLFFWNLVLTGFFWAILSHYRRLTKEVGKESLPRLLDQILKNLEKQNKESKNAQELLVLLEKRGRSHYQKAGLVRFNPFAEMGGNQSFSFALLDDFESGFLITSLHGRNLTRLYIKIVKSGKVADGKLSKEEELAIKQAIAIRS
ncbi:MAG: DUF4446 family protein [Candidatus Shapirobacteria bacterium]